MGKMLSFIIPVYNSENYLGKCLKSVFSQTNQNFQVVLVNDGSKDNSQKIIDKYKNRYPDQVIAFQQENQGISAARNKGIELAEGEYITFIDNDDLIEPTYVEKVLSVIREKKSDMIVFGYDTINEKGKRMDTYPVAKDPKWVRWGVCTVWLIVAKKSLYQNNNIKFPIGLFNEDIPVSLHLAYNAEKIDIVDEILYHYRLYGGNTSSRMHSKFESAPESRVNVFRELKGISDKLEDSVAKWMLEYYAVRFYYGMLLVHFKSATREELLDEYYKHTKAIKMFYPDYKKTKVYLTKPKGEPVKKRIAVWLSIVLDRIGLFKMFLLIMNGKWLSK